MKRHNGPAIVTKVRKGRLLDLLACLQPLPEEFPDMDDTLLPLERRGSLNVLRRTRGTWRPWVSHRRPTSAGRP